MPMPGILPNSHPDTLSAPCFSAAPDPVGPINFSRAYSVLSEDHSAAGSSGDIPSASWNISHDPSVVKVLGVTNLPANPYNRLS